MPTNRWIPSIVASAALSIVLGCVNHQADPLGISLDHVTLSVTLSAPQGSPSHPVIASGLAINAGESTKAYLAGCDPQAGVFFVLLDPHGNEVLLRDPHAPVPECPVGLAALGPGGRIQGGAAFDGALYTTEGVRYQAPAGEYTFMTRLWVYDGRGWEADRRELEARQTFRWSHE